MKLPFDGIRKLTGHSEKLRARDPGADRLGHKPDVWAAVPSRGVFHFRRISRGAEPLRGAQHRPKGRGDWGDCPAHFHFFLLEPQWLHHKSEPEPAPRRDNLSDPGVLCRRAPCSTLSPELATYVLSGEKMTYLSSILMCVL